MWQQIVEVLAQAADNEYATIDSTIVRAHQHSAGARGNPASEALGRSKGGMSTKIHATCDALGNPTRFYLSPGQAHDLEGADVLLNGLEAEALLAELR